MGATLASSRRASPDAAASPALTRGKAAESAGRLAVAVATTTDPSKLKNAANVLAGKGASAGPEIAVITNIDELNKFLLEYAAGRGLKDTQRQFIFKPEPGGTGPVASVCEYLEIVSGRKKLTDIDTLKPVSAKFQISAFVSDLFKAAGIDDVPPSTRLMRLDVKNINFLGGGGWQVPVGKAKGSPAESIASKLDIAGYNLTEGKREKDQPGKELSPKAITELATARVKLYATMVRDLIDVSKEVAGLGGGEAQARAAHLRTYAQEILDQHFKGMKVDEFSAKGRSIKPLTEVADLSKFKEEVRAAQGISADACKVTSIKELMLGDSKEGRGLAAKEFVYHLANYYKMFPKGEVEVVNTYLKYMLHPDFASMNWNIVALSANDKAGNTRGVAGIHYQAPDPFVILSELEKAKPGLLEKRLGVKPADLRSFLDSLKPEEQALISSAWVEHFYRNPTEKPEAGKQLIKEALGIAKSLGNGVVSFEHEDVNKTSWQLDVYSAAMVGLHPNERAVAYAISGGARIMVDPKTEKPLLNVQPELQKGGEQNYDLAWGFIFKEGKIPETLSTAAVKTFLLARYGTIDAIDPRDDKSKAGKTAFAQMFDRLNELEKLGVKEINFVASRDVFFRDPKAA